MAINKNVSQKYLYGERNIFTVISYQLTVTNTLLVVKQVLKLQIINSTTISMELNVEQVSNLFMKSDEQVGNLFYS